MSNSTCLHNLPSFYCNDINIVLAFSSCKIDSCFNVKDLIPNGLSSCVVYKFSCANCHACYIGETTRHWPLLISSPLLL